MAEITLEDIKTYLKDNADNAEVKEYVNSFIPKVDMQYVKDLVKNNDVFKTDYFKELDSVRTKGIESWKNNNLQKIIDDEIAKRNVKVEETEEQKKLRELTEKIEKQEKDNLNTKILNVALKTATEKNIDPQLVEYLNLGEDEEQVKEKIETFATIFQNNVTTATEGHFKQFGKKPPKQGGDGNGLTLEKIERMTPEELKKNEADINAFLAQEIQEQEKA